MKYKNRLFMIENITNMHVGSGEANFGIVDNLVQRDAITGFPTIHSSSLKGALREFFEYSENEPFMKFIFGDEDKNPGNVKFFQADFLGMPLRSSGVPYLFGTSVQILKNLVSFTDKLGIDFDNKEKIKELVENHKDVNHILLNKKDKIEYIEEYEIGNESEEKDLMVLAEFFEEDYVALLPEGIFKELAGNLPVIARNKLNNGKSENLFYEEIVPKKSKFFTVFALPVNLNTEDSAEIEGYMGRFISNISDRKNLIQLGANASIGYGICRFKEISRIE